MQKPNILDLETVPIHIPLELLQEAGIDPDDTVQMTVSEGRLILEHFDAPCSMVCFGNCAHCPGTEICSDFDR